MVGLGHNGLIIEPTTNSLPDRTRQSYRISSRLTFAPVFYQVNPINFTPIFMEMHMFLSIFRQGKYHCSILYLNFIMEKNRGFVEETKFTAGHEVTIVHWLRKPVWRQAIIWTNVDLLLIRPFGTNLHEILNIRNKFQWNFNRNTNIFIQENVCWTNVGNIWIIFQGNMNQNINIFSHEWIWNCSLWICCHFVSTPMC